VSPVKFIQNSFFEVFVLDTPDFGQISLGYFNAFKAIPNLPLSQQSEVKNWLSDLFRTSAVVGGDLNSTPHRINRLLSELGLTARLSDFPTYLPSIPDPQSEITLPSFDDFLILDKNIQFLARPLVKLPLHISHNPRDLVNQLNLSSDHVPVTCRLTKGESSLNLGIFNVADPVFWKPFYPATADGFDLTTEPRRLERLKSIISDLLTQCDVLCLLEVPAPLVPWLATKDARLEKMFSTTTQSDSISRLALIC